MLIGTSALMLNAPTDNFWVMLNKEHFNHLCSSGKDLSRPILLTDITGATLYFYRVSQIKVFITY